MYLMFKTYMFNILYFFNIYGLAFKKIFSMQVLQFYEYYKIKLLTKFSFNCFD